MTSSSVTPHEAVGFTGERFHPEVDGQIAFEHFHRYRFASGFVRSKNVLDVACGEGYGSDLLAAVAGNVVGLDIAPEVVAHAKARYTRKNLKFVTGSASALPFKNAKFDTVVSFETIEHHDRHQEMVTEIKRVLRPGGMLIISSPNKQHYSIDPGYRNPFHVKELFREELLDLLGQHFSHVSVYGQRVVHGSLIVPDDGGRFESALQDGNDVQHSSGLLNPLYDLVIATDSELPTRAGSLFEIKVHGMDPASFYGAHLQERVNEADRDVAQLKAQIQQKESWDEALTALRRELGSRPQAHEAEAQMLRVELNARDGRLDALNQVIAEKEQRLVEAAARSAEQANGFSELRAHTDALVSLRGELEARLQAAHVEVSLLRAEVAAGEGRHETLQQVVAEKEARLVVAGQILQQRDSWIVELRTHADALSALRAELESRLQTAEIQVSTLRAELAATEGWVGELRARADSLTAVRADLERELHSRDLRIAALGVQLDERHALIAELNRAVETSRDYIDTLHNSRSWRSTAWIRRLSTMINGGEG